MTRHSNLVGRITLTAVVVVLMVLSLAAPGEAQRRARLSSDLSERIARGADARLDVIAKGDRATIERLQARHGFRVREYFKDGALLEGTTNQFAAAQDDIDLSASHDADVHGQMAITG
ncbi:MAG: hypothetical protein Q7V01_14450, partial [Vicinamibacterales bacterium]|nr:hypothetical protein [Vicinamibacterales bacterium]